MFKRVEGFLWYCCPGLSVNARAVEEARARFGIPVRQYPSPDCIAALRDGIWCDSPRSRDDWPDVTIQDVYRLARADSGIHLVADGCRKEDSPRRRELISKGRLPAWNLTPIGDWLTYEVKSYLALRKIPLPEQQGVMGGRRARSSGVALDHESLLWLHDKYPDDFKTLCRVFPYAEAAVYRREFYGATA